MEQERITEEEKKWHQCLEEQIQPPDKESMEQAALRWKKIAKPLFSLGRLEEAVIRMAGMKKTADFTLEKKALVIMCADNGVVEEGVTQTGQEVTAIVADNFTKEAEACTSIMAEYAKVKVVPVDIGMAVDVPSVTRIEDKVTYGTKNFAKEPAMTRAQAMQAIDTGVRIVRELREQGTQILATGEMGIGNTTSSSAVVSVLLDKPVEEVTGRGAGLTSAGLARKMQVIRQAILLHQPEKEDVIDVLSKVGGLDIAGLTGVFIGGAIFRIPVVIDGFISAAAALCAARLFPESVDYMLPSHISGEPAAKMILEELHLSAFLDCGMHLGEGSGAVAVLPLLEMGLEVYRKMSTFEEIRVEQYEELK